MPSAKPTLKTQELQKHDLKKFLKRVSTPQGTKTGKGQTVITPKGSAAAGKKKDPKVKSKVKKPVTIIMSTKRPSTQPYTSSLFVSKQIPTK